MSDKVSRKFRNFLFVPPTCFFQSILACIISFTFCKICPLLLVQLSIPFLNWFFVLGKCLGGNLGLIYKLKKWYEVISTKSLMSSLAAEKGQLFIILSISVRNTDKTWSANIRSLIIYCLIFWPRPPQHQPSIDGGLNFRMIYPWFQSSLILEIPNFCNAWDSSCWALTKQVPLSSLIDLE